MTAPRVHVALRVVKRTGEYESVTVEMGEEKDADDVLPPSAVRLQLYEDLKRDVDANLDDWLRNHTKPPAGKPPEAPAAAPKSLRTPKCKYCGAEILWPSGRKPGDLPKNLDGAEHRCKT